MVTCVIFKIMNCAYVKLRKHVGLTANIVFKNVAFVNSIENNNHVSNVINIAVKPTINIIINKTVDKNETYFSDIVEYTIEISYK